MMMKKLSWLMKKSQKMFKKAFKSQDGTFIYNFYTKMN